MSTLTLIITVLCGCASIVIFIDTQRALRGYSTHWLVPVILWILFTIAFTGLILQTETLYLIMLFLTSVLLGFGAYMFTKKHINQLSVNQKAIEEQTKGSGSGDEIAR